MKANITYGASPTLTIIPESEIEDFALKAFFDNYMSYDIKAGDCRATYEFRSYKKPKEQS